MYLSLCLLSDKYFNIILRNINFIEYFAISILSLFINQSKDFTIFFYIMPKILTFIDIFPGYSYERVNYADQEKQKSSLGGCSAIFYVFFLMGITVYYAIPVFEMRNPKI